MVTQSSLKLLLYRIKDQLFEVLTEDREHALIKLDNLSRELNSILRELKSQRDMKGVHGAASVRGRPAEGFEVYRLAKEIQAQLEDLLTRKSQMNEFELSKEIGEKVEELYSQFLAGHEIHGAPDHAAYIPAGKSDYGGTMEGCAIAVFVVLRAWFQKLKRGESKK